MTEPLLLPKKHAIITIEPLDDNPETNQPPRKLSSIFAFTSQQSGRYPSGPSAELQRQQRRRLVIHFFGWVMVLLMIVLAAFLVYFIIARK